MLGLHRHFGLKQKTDKMANLGLNNCGEGSVTATRCPFLPTCVLFSL